MRCIGLSLIFPLFTCNVEAQDSAGVQQIFVGLNLPQHICSGSQQVLNFGFSPNNNVQLAEPATTLGHNDRVFLPDGQPCGELGCSYRSPVIFTDFEEGAVIESANDILYVMLNIEHSWIGDIYINISCPNGQSADLMKFSGSGISNCTGDIDNSHIGWDNTYPNSSTSTYLGNPVDGEDRHLPCDSTSYANRPGTGWTYCWSNNTSGEYSYAPDDARIYRLASANSHHVDSSDVQAKSNFYHPEDSFNNLIGCPLNGEWYIEVIDGWSIDNGYIFKWELALDPQRLPQQYNADTSAPCTIDSYNIDGPYITQTDSTSFLLDVPDLSGDTSITYTFSITNSCGDTFDTTATIYLHGNNTGSGPDSVSACDSYIWLGQDLTSDTVATITYQSQYGCDSVVQVALHIRHSTTCVIYDTIVENELPYSIGSLSFTKENFQNDAGLPVDNITVQLPTLLNADGCDSLRSYNLLLHRNVHTVLDSTVCFSSLPLKWHDITFDTTAHYMDKMTDSIILPTHTGADSIITLTLTVNPTYHITDSVSVCDSLRWIDNNIYLDDTSGISVILHSVAQCDSVITLDLTMHHSSSTYLRDTFCQGQTYLWNGNSLTGNDEALTEDFTMHATFRTVHNCDSLVTLTVTKMAVPHITITAEADCDRMCHIISADATAPLTAGSTPQPMPYLLWSSDPPDAHLDTIDPRQTTFTVQPLEPTEYLLYCDYSEQPLCPSTGLIKLGPVVVQKAQLKVTPEHLSHDIPEFTAYDLDPDGHRRTWLLDGVPQAEDSPALNAVANILHDSVVVTLAIDNGLCQDTTSQTITIRHLLVTAPNVFTPSVEGDNSRFIIATQGVLDAELHIYNRDGLLVYTTHDISQGWDGRTNNGVNCPQAAYAWVLIYTPADEPETRQKEVGTVLLLR